VSGIYRGERDDMHCVGLIHCRLRLVEDFDIINDRFLSLGDNRNEFIFCEWRMNRK